MLLQDLVSIGHLASVAFPAGFCLGLLLNFVGDFDYKTAFIFFISFLFYYKVGGKFAGFSVAFTARLKPNRHRDDCSTCRTRS